MSDRDRNDDLPIIPASPGVGVPVITPAPLGDEPDDYVDQEVMAEEQDAELIDDDSGLLDPGSPEFDHSLRRKTDD